MVVLFTVIILAIAGLAIWASWRVFADDLSTPGQRWAQFAFVWLVPIVGPIIAIHLKRKAPERGSCTYRDLPDTVDDFGNFKSLAENTRHDALGPGEGPRDQ